MPYMHAHTHILNHHLIKLLPPGGVHDFTMDSFTLGPPLSTPKGKYSSNLRKNMQQKHSPSASSVSSVRKYLPSCCGPQELLGFLKGSLYLNSLYLMQLQSSFTASLYHLWPCQQDASYQVAAASESSRLSLAAMLCTMSLFSRTYICLAYNLFLERSIVPGI